MALTNERGSDHAEAPTDESWRKDFWNFITDDATDNGDPRFRLEAVFASEMIEFIASLLQKTKEKDQKIFDEYIDAQFEAGKSEGLKEGTQQLMAIHESGKSEVFSLVREMISELQKHRFVRQSFNRPFIHPRI